MGSEKQLTRLQKKYCESAARGRNPTEAAREAGYKNPARAVMVLEKNERVQREIQRQKEAVRKETVQEEEPEVADQGEILEFLTQTMRGDEEPRIRMKAAELLGKMKDTGEKEERVVIVDDVK